MLEIHAKSLSICLCSGCLPELFQVQDIVSSFVIGIATKHVLPTNTLSEGMLEDDPDVVESKPADQEPQEMKRMEHPKWATTALSS